MPARTAPSRPTAPRISAAELDLDLPAVTEVLVEFIRRETRKAGLPRLVVGLSGGVDSAVAATLACRALPPCAVTCVRMPYRTSDPRSLADAGRLARGLRTRLLTVPITPMVDAYLKARPGIPRLRRGNLMARQRMIVLYDLSAAGRALVLGTSNKTELLLGYGTLHGDMASGINPIGDLYKTQVRALARHLGVPAAIVGKAPTADLWAGQSDEAELGFAYADIDRLLLLLVDRRLEPAEAIAAGFPRRMVEAIGARVRGSQFKRRTPIVAKIAARTVGVDFRYPRDWGR
jgi:NAD+ synthase